MAQLRRMIIYKIKESGNANAIKNDLVYFQQKNIVALALPDPYTCYTYEDTNRNGKFDAVDTNFTNVRIWQDTNSDGISQAGELHILAEVGRYFKLNLAQRKVA